MNDKLQALLKSLNITKEGKMSNNKYLITLDNSDEYSRMYTNLDKNGDTYLDPEGMIMSSSTSLMTYLTDDFDITLKADFDNDNYYLIIEEAK